MLHTEISAKEVEEHAEYCLHVLEEFFLEKEKTLEINPDYYNLYTIAVLFKAIEFLVLEGLFGSEHRSL